MLAWCRAQGIPVDVPWRDLPEASRTRILRGDGGWDGVDGYFRCLESKTYKVHVRVFLSRYRGYPTCPDCGGGRLAEEGRAWRVAGRTLPEVCAMSVADARRFFDEVGTAGMGMGSGGGMGGARGAGGGGSPAVAPPPAPLLLPPPPAARPSRRLSPAEAILAEVRLRLEVLEASGLGYLTLDRQARTLSGGEAQRVHLTTALGTQLVDALYVLDEPSRRPPPARQRAPRADPAAAARRREHGRRRRARPGDPRARPTTSSTWAPAPGERGGRVVAIGSPAEVMRERGVADGRVARRGGAACRGPRRGGRSRGGRSWACAARARTTSRASTCSCRSAR